MEQENNNSVLNLDEVLGETKLKVRLMNGKEYPIRSVNSLTPQEFGRVMAYGTKFASLTEDEFTNNGETVLKSIDDVIEIIAPSLPRYKPTLKERFTRGYKRRFAVSLQEATAIMQFWTEKNRSKNALGAVKPKTKKRPR